MFSDTNHKTEDSAYAIENKNDEPKDTYFTGKLDSKTPTDVCREGQTLNIIQETATVQRDQKNSDDSCIRNFKTLAIKGREPENDQSASSCPSVITGDTAAMATIKEPTACIVQTGISDMYTVGAVRPF